MFYYIRPLIRAQCLHLGEESRKIGAGAVEPGVTCHMLPCAGNTLLHLLSGDIFVYSNKKDEGALQTLPAPS